MVFYDGWVGSLWYHWCAKFILYGTVWVDTEWPYINKLLYVVENSR